jgi:uncharacterized protein
MDEALDLADWRRRTAQLYLAEPLAGPEGAESWRRGRDQLLRTHPQSPVPAADRAGYPGAPYWPWDQSAVVTTKLVPAAERAGERSDAVHGRPPEPGDEPDLRVDTGGPDGVLRYRRVGRLATPWGELTLFWLVAYGGGLFLPFRDQTAGRASYGGGRYLTDTVKGTFGRGLVALDDGQVALDFNYAYNPSCAYDPGWACPLAPPENHLAGAVEAGERYEAGGPVVT